jgi:hypothetical protein
MNTTLPSPGSEVLKVFLGEKIALHGRHKICNLQLGWARNCNKSKNCLSILCEQNTTGGRPQRRMRAAAIAINREARVTQLEKELNVSENKNGAVKKRISTLQGPTEEKTSNTDGGARPVSIHDYMEQVN